MKLFRNNGGMRSDFTTILGLISLLTLKGPVDAGEPIKTVASYSDFQKAGFEAKLDYIGDILVAIQLYTPDPHYTTPAWLGAFYIMERTGTSPKANYFWTPAKEENPVSVSFPYGETEDDIVFVFGPSLPKGSSLTGKQYLAISANDLVTWKKKKHE